MEALPLPFYTNNSTGGLSAAAAAAAAAMPDPPASSLQIFALFIIFFFPALALVVVLIRVAGRFATRQFGWDDWLISVAMLLSVAETVISYFFVKTNFIGIHADQIPPRDPTEALIWAYAVQILYNPILALVKSSVLIFLLRLFGQKDGVRRFILYLNVVNIAQMIAVLVAITLQCIPIQRNWDPTVRGGHCVDRSILFTFNASFNILTDLLVLGLPIYIFVDLQIPRRAKIALLFVFLLGFLVTIASVVRLVIFVQGLFGLVQSDDPTFNIGFVTSAIETNLALITASAPALRPILRSRDRSRWFGRPSTSPQGGGGGGAGKLGPDLEAGGQKSLGWPRSPSPSAAAAHVGSGVGGKFGRGGSRGGRRGTRSGRGRGGSHSAKKYEIRIRRHNSSGGGDAAELRSRTPRSSEEEAMTANGIMRVSDIQREIDGIVKEIAVSGSGTYTGGGGGGGGGGGLARSSSRGSRGSSSSASSSSPPTGPVGQPRSLTNNNNRAERSYTKTGAAREESNMNNFRNTGFDFFATAERSSDRDASGGGSARKTSPERYDSESVYADADVSDDESRDYGDERISKYGEKRFGVVTPRGTTPTSRTWRDEAGRPF